MPRLSRHPFLVVSVWLLATSAYSQKPSPSLDVGKVFKGKEYQPVIFMIMQWNEKKLGKMTKDTFAKDYIEGIRNSAKNKGAMWAKARLGVWEKLPPTLAPRLPLSDDGQLLLLAMYKANARAFVSKYKATRDQEYRLMLKLYPILSIAQEEAQKDESKSIKAAHVFVGIERSFTGLWPFCPDK